jgi:predicted dienelactone hydrolase
MEARRRMIAGALWLLAATPALAQETIALDRQDGVRIAARVFSPAGARCVGTAIISHGAGGSEKGYGYLAQAMRRDGWLVAVVGHAESGPDAMRGHMARQGLRAGLGELVTDPSAYAARFMDIEAATRWARGRCKAPLAVLLGHSMGAATVMLEAGAKNKLGLAGRDAFDAYVALSPQGPGAIFPAGAWASIGKPVLLVTGTRDAALEGDWTSRTAAFDSLPAGCKWLAVLDGATHLNFAGLGASATTERLTTLAVARFLEGVARGDCSSPPNENGMKIRTG